MMAAVSWPISDSSSLVMLPSGRNRQGPEGNITKLLLSEIGHETPRQMAELAGPDAAFLDGDGAIRATLMLMNRAMRRGDQAIRIAERILGPATRSSYRTPNHP